MRVRGLGELKFVVDHRASQGWKEFQRVVVALYHRGREITYLTLKLVPKEGLDPQQLDQILSKAEGFRLPLLLRSVKRDARDRLLEFELEGHIRDLEGCLKKAAKLLEKAVKLLKKKQSKENAYSK